MPESVEVGQIWSFDGEQWEVKRIIGVLATIWCLDADKRVKIRLTTLLEGKGTDGVNWTFVS